MQSLFLALLLVLASIAFAGHSADALLLEPQGRVGIRLGRRRGGG